MGWPSDPAHVADRYLPWDWSGSVATESGIVFGDANALDGASAWTEENPGARAGVAGDTGNVIREATLLNDGQVPIEWSNNQLDAQGYGDPDNRHTLNPGASIQVTNLAKLCVWNPSASAAGSVQVHGSLTRQANVKTSLKPGGHPGHARPLTWDSTRLTFDSTNVSFDQTEYR